MYLYIHVYIYLKPPDSVPCLLLRSGRAASPTRATLAPGAKTSGPARRRCIARSRAAAST